MLSRPATKISLTNEDVALYEQRKMARDAIRAQQQHVSMEDSSQASDQSTIDDGGRDREEELTPAAQTRAARVKMSREQRIGVGGSR
jgi:hypothetical protein